MIDIVTQLREQQSVTQDYASTEQNELQDVAANEIVILRYALKEAIEWCRCSVDYEDNTSCLKSMVNDWNAILPGLEK